MAAAVPFAMVLMIISSGMADSKDTPETVMATGKAASAEVNKLLIELKQQAGKADPAAKAEINLQVDGLMKIQALYDRMGRDRAFASQMLALSLKKDNAGLGALWQQEIPGSKIQIREIKDFNAYVVYEVNGYLWEACVCSNACCGGTYAYHRMIGKAKT